VCVAEEWADQVSYRGGYYYGSGSIYVFKGTSVIVQKFLACAYKNSTYTLFQNIVEAAS